MITYGTMAVQSYPCVSMSPGRSARQPLNSIINSITVSDIGITITCIRKSDEVDLTPRRQTLTSRIDITVILRSSDQALHSFLSTVFLLFELPGLRLSHKSVNVFIRSHNACSFRHFEHDVLRKHTSHDSHVLENNEAPKCGSNQYHITFA